MTNHTLRALLEAGRRAETMTEILEFIDRLAKIEPFRPFNICFAGRSMSINAPDDIVIEGGAILVDAGDCFWILNPSAVEWIKADGIGVDKFLRISREARERFYADAAARAKAARNSISGA